MTEAVVRDFVADYAREADYYRTTARLCGGRCEALLAARGVRAIVTHRAKRPNKLLAKLLKRDLDKRYGSHEEIRDDIPDLAGVRIALYFPGDRHRAEALIRDSFDILDTRVFPLDSSRLPGKRFDGYHADHYRVRLRAGGLTEAEQAYAAAKVEIQVGSVLMHAWAEVEHDLVYKPESGALSEDEHAILDELNGLVIAGEVALERLQRAVQRRLSESDAPFANHYELAAILQRWMHGSRSATEPQAATEPRLGRIDLLWALLRRAGLNSATRFTDLLGPPGLLSDAAPISNQAIDIVLARRPDLYATYASLQHDAALAEIAPAETGGTPGELAAAIGRFLSGWIVLERVFAILADGAGGQVPAGGHRHGLRMPEIARAVGLSPASREALPHLRRLRNRLVHGSEVPDRAELDAAAATVDALFADLEAHPDAAVRSAYAAARAGFTGAGEAVTAAG